MSAFTLSLINKDPATVEVALEKIYLPALTLPALLFHKALISQYDEFAKQRHAGEVIKYFIRLDTNGIFTEALSIEDGGEITLLMSQTTPLTEDVQRCKGAHMEFRPSYMASVAVMHSLLSEVDRNVCYPHQKLGLLRTVTLMLTHIDKTHVYSVTTETGHGFAIQGIGPDMATGPYFVIKTNSWSSVTLNNYVKHNSPFHPDAVSEAVH